MGISGYEYLLSCVVVSGDEDLKIQNGVGVALDNPRPPPRRPSVPNPPPIP